MKKLLIICMILTASLTARAADYLYLTFETGDGEKTSVSVSNLTLTVSGTTLTAGTQSFTLTNLSKMYFSASDETTGIQSLRDDNSDEVTDIYDLRGNKISREQMIPGGVYIIRTAQGTHKITVK